MSASCKDGDLDCYIGFLRALCFQFESWLEATCSSGDFSRAINKKTECRPGQTGCEGFQAIFGGPRNTECLPWDLLCTLNDQFGEAGEAGNGEGEHPLLLGMPKSSLTSQELAQLDSFVSIVYGDYWQKGLFSSDEMTVTERNSFYALGSKLLTVEGFSAFY